MTEEHQNLRLDAAFALAREHLQSRGFQPVYMAVKGSRLYGMPGTHKDTDIRAVYLAPTTGMLSIRKPQHTVEAMDGDLDLVGWEAERFFHHLLKHNGNMIEMLLAPSQFILGSEHGPALRALGEKFLTRKLHKFYSGFALNQLRRASKGAESQARTGKNIVYLYRELYAGIVLLVTGILIFPWDELLRQVHDLGLPHSGVLGQVTMDRSEVERGVLDEVGAEFSELIQFLDASVEDSPLPRDYDGYDVCNRLLLEWRSKNWR